MTSVRIPEEDAYHRACNFCVFSRVQKGIPELTHKGCVLTLVSLGTLNDVTLVLGMRQSISPCVLRPKKKVFDWRNIKKKDRVGR